MTLITLRTAIYVGVTSVGAVLLVSMTACSAILLTLFLKAVLAAILQAIATVGEIGIATVAAIASGFTISLTVVLAASASAVTFPPSYIEARLVIAVAVATTSIATSAMALFLMTSLRLDLELGVAVVTSAAVSVAFASAWAVGAMSMIERETHHVGLKMTSLLQAVRHNQYHVLKLLVRLPFGCQKEEITTALLYAIKAGYVNCVRVLLDAGADPNIQNAYDNTPLISACQIGCRDTVQLILEAGAVVNFLNDNQETALHHCAKWGHEDSVRLLLRKGADPMLKDNLKRTPLMLAARHARKPSNIMSILIEAGSSVNAVASDHRTVLHYAATRGIDIGCLLNAHMELEIQDAEGNTSLHLASIEGHVDVVESLIRAGANINPTNYVRQTPMHLASAHGHITTIETLLQHHADPMCSDNAGYQPITIAVQHNRSIAVLYFLKHNYFPMATHARSSSNNSSSVSSSSTSATPTVNPIRVALERNYFHLARLLVLGGCNCSPLRSPELMAERSIWHSDDQMLHFIWLKTSIQQPWSLLERCRVVIRHHVYKPMTDISLLPIPKQLRQFLGLADLGILCDDHLIVGS